MASSSSKSRERVSDFGYVYHWQEVERFATDPPKVRPPGMADGSGRVQFATLPKERQVTVSENHPSWRSKPKGEFSGDIGGEFYTSKTWTEFRTQDVLLWERFVSGGTAQRLYRRGPVLPFNPSSLGSSAYPPDKSSNKDSLDEVGATAIARCKPTNSTADAATMLGEVLLGGLPKLVGASLWKDKTRDARRLSRRGANEFLNLEYGWLPMAADMSDIALAIYTADATLKQYQRDSGKMVRRRYSFPPVYESSFSTVDSSAAEYLPVFSASRFRHNLGSPGRVVRERQTLTTRWFSGAFTYYLPSGGNTYGAMTRDALYAKRMLGLDLSPETVWNLAPWSWAVDWFSNAGDVVSNLSDWMTDGLCLRYGYVMESVDSRDTYTYVGPGTLKRYAGPPPSITFRRMTKQRRRANPFGFGLTWNGLTPIQLAIAGALGISRS